MCLANEDKYDNDDVDGAGVDCEGSVLKEEPSPFHTLVFQIVRFKRDRFQHISVLGGWGKRSAEGV